MRKFVAINLQETGGKNYKVYAKDVDEFVKEITLRLSNDYAYCRGYFDVEYQFVEQFTVYFFF